MSEEVTQERENKYLEFVTAIQQIARTSELSNGVAKELTYQQGLSILLRSKQLIREGALHSNRISREDKIRQINKCYEQREQRQRTR